MSINHYSSDQIPEPHFYMMDSSSPGQNPIFFSRLMPKIATTSRPTSDEHMVMSSADDGDSKSSSSLFLDLDQNQRREKEHLFEKPLTPSDVGKLNRLVIPKQHAEKYFPLGGGGGDGEGEKGFLLSFEDEAGKPWKFRYSYWNSSQSYVLTKGWSRFVKEKRLDAGDFVVFYRHLAEADRLFIGWRRRHSGEEGGGAQAVAGRGMFYNPSQNQMQVQGCSTSPSYQPECVHSASVAPTSGNSKKLRLFGVNLECQAEDSDPSAASPADGGSPISGDIPRWPSPYHHQYYVGHHHDQRVHYPAVFY